MADNDFTAVFFEEAAEHLQAIENELLTLDVNPEDEEALNAVFRAAHSIKGSAGMFGFTTLSGFTHHLETLLDLVRKGQADLNDERVELTLQSLDEIRTLVAALESGETDPEADPALTEALEREVAVARGSAEATAAAPVDDDSFGLFTDEPEGDDDGFGLFADEPEDSDDSFGLFTDTPEDDDGFGLFSEDGPSAAEPPEDPASTSSGSAYAVYFDEMLKESDDATQTPPAKPASARPAETRSEQTPAEPATPTRRASKPRQTSESSGKAASASLRVSLEKVDELVNQISELVITQAMLQETGQRLDPVANERHLATLETLERNTRELQESVLSIRLLPVSFLFSRFPRVVRDLSRSLGKEVDLIQLGEQTELDKSLIEKLADPLTHLVRNSIDHGVEGPEQREASGKPRRGQVVMSAAHEGGNIAITISDDGAGIDREKILAKARDNGMEVSDDWSDEQVFGLIFEPGFSTAAAVTDVSGRGVGMDVVKRNIKELGGRIDVDSRVGEGSRFTVRLPLTLAITDGMVVRVGGERYVIPLAAVVESQQLAGEDLFEVKGKARVIRRHGDYLRVQDLAASLEPGVARDRGPDQDCLAVVVESEGRQVALVVDELVGQQQIVIKNLEANYRKVAGFSGATVMGDGSVAFILDISHFVAHGGLEPSTVAADNPTA